MMQSDVAGNVMSMDENEILAYELYSKQRDAPKGLKFDRIPYSSNFGWIRTRFNETTGEEWSHRHIWLLLQSVLQRSTEIQLDTFLANRGRGGGR